MRNSRWSILLASAVLAIAARASAAPPTTSPAAKALAKGQEAVKLFDEGNYEEALTRFQQADALYHSPVFVLYAGRSLREAKHWVEASAVLRRVTNESIAEDAPAPWRQAQADAKRELAALLAEIPSVIVKVEGRTASTQATIDGNATRIGELVEVDPGTHTIRALDERREPVATTVTLVPGAKGLDVVLVFPTVAPVVTGPLGTTTSTRPGLYRPGLWLAGGGAAAVAAGGVFGILALARSSAALPPACRDGVCPESRRGEVDETLDPALRLANVADVLFIAGGVAIVVGAYLAFSRSHAPASP